MANSAFDGPTWSPGDLPGTVRRLVEVVANMLRGNLNATLDVTLTAGATSTTVKDARLGPFSHIAPMPLTASASTAEKAGIWFSGQFNGQVTINHASSAATDQNVRLLIVG
jgi:LDH2 family malate/lactate/ureidoglycolate dehydrogenase